MSVGPGASADESPEYRLKVAFVYNFALFTEWPAEVGGTLNLRIHGQDPFGKDIDLLQGKAVGGRSISMQCRGASQTRGCQVVFVSASAIGSLPYPKPGMRDHGRVPGNDQVGSETKTAHAV